MEVRNLKKMQIFRKITVEVKISYRFCRKIDYKYFV